MYNGITPHPTFEKGNTAMLKVMVELTRLGYWISLPFNQQLPYDLLAHDPKNHKIYRLQVKFMSHGGMISSGRSSISRQKYNLEDFDFYAIYLLDVNTVIYAPVCFADKTIQTQIPTGYRTYYWFEDFLIFEPKREAYSKRPASRIGTPRLAQRKVVRPSKEELEKMVWEKPCLQLAKQFGLKSSFTISRWCKEYGISKPPRGYWERFYHPPKSGTS